MSTSGYNKRSKIISPGSVFLGGLLLVITGLGLNYFSGVAGELILKPGKPNNLPVKIDRIVNTEVRNNDLGIIITLDTLMVEAHDPTYEILLWKTDTASVVSSAYGKGPPANLIGQYSLDLLKARKIEDTYLRFRVKDFYPNFEFAYEYPSDRDTIVPKAPGITLELKTKEGTPIVTLLSGQGKKNLLGDIVSLGASLAFYWNLDTDSLKAIAVDQALYDKKIVFSGADQKVYFILEGHVEEQQLKENFFYPMPGQDTIGFKILYCFPDASFLKAVPSTKGISPVNPVAHVEIWRHGQGAMDAYVYPESRSRVGGTFEIPGTAYKIGLGMDQELERKYCHCVVSIRSVKQKSTETITFKAGESKNSHGYLFSPVLCKDDEFGKTVTMKVMQRPGNNIVTAGLIFAAVALIFQLLIRK